MKLIPTRTQWKDWTLPSKLTAIGTLVGIIGVLLYFVPNGQNHQSVQSTHITTKSVGPFSPAITASGSNSAVSVTYNVSLNKAAQLSPYLNGQPITSGQHIRVPKSGDQHILNFGVRNTGDGSAENLTLHFFYPSAVTNIVPSGDWRSAPAKGLQGGEWQDLSIIRAISTTAQQPIHPKRGGFVCAPIFWQPAVIFAVTQQVMVVASARDTEETRHIFSIVLLPEQDVGH